MLLGTRLVTINRLGSVLLTSSAAYRGRVSGSGGPLSGQAVFTLTPITRNDEGFYGCKINAFNDPFDVPNYDSVPLVVQGTYLFFKKRQNKTKIIFKPNKQKSQTCLQGCKNGHAKEVW